jgi:hypothetical protein
VHATLAARPAEFSPFRSGILESCLELAEPVFVRGEDALRQLRYIEAYASDLECRSIAVERLYIDRDYMEDHSVFYSKSLHPYPNRCQRVHFFSLEEAEVRSEIRRVLEVGVSGGTHAYHEACRAFSANAYLGFSVVKPLPGSPIGRTVLRCFPETKEPSGGAALRDFGCTRVYSTHLYGVELRVRGLAFQQQDMGVSACATTAIWSALQKVRDHEDISPVTPAQITSLAGKHSLPFGRAMPSEGLSIDQMCQAIQAVGVSPNVFRTDRIGDARAYVYSAVKSGVSPVLVLKLGGGHHAVAVAGMKIRTPHVPSPLAVPADDVAGDVVALYIHDDRRGPYLRANLTEKEGRPYLSVSLREAGEGPEVWEMTHIIAPFHAKIRLSLADLRKLALHVVANVNAGRDAVEKAYQLAPIDPAIVGFEFWIRRSHKYLESMFLGVGSLSAEVVEKFCATVTVARYLGVVRLSAPYFDPIDVLIDTTGTLKNAHCVGIFAPHSSRPLTRVIASYLASCYQCPLVP